MNGTTQIDSKNKTRRMLVRGVLVLIYSALIVLSFVMGKGHTILLDNKDADQGTVKAFENVTVSVDGQEIIEIPSGIRDKVKVRAQWHTIKITVDDKSVEKKFTVPLGLDVALLSIPKLFAGVEPALIPFVLADEPPPPPDPDAGKSNEFTSPGGTPEVPVVPAL